MRRPVSAALPAYPSDGFIQIAGAQHRRAEERAATRGPEQVKPVLTPGRHSFHDAALSCPRDPCRTADGRGEYVDAAQGAQPQDAFQGRGEGRFTTRLLSNAIEEEHDLRPLIDVQQATPRLVRQPGQEL